MINHLTAPVLTISQSISRCIAIVCSFVSFFNLQLLMGGLFFLIFVFLESYSVTVVSKYFLNVESRDNTHYLFESIKPHQIAILRPSEEC